MPLSLPVFVHNIENINAWQPNQKLTAQGLLVMSEAGTVSLQIDAEHCTVEPAAAPSNDKIASTQTLWCSFTGAVIRAIYKNFETGRVCRWDIELLQPVGVPTVTCWCVPLS